MPVTIRGKRKDLVEEVRTGDGVEQIQPSFTRFVYRPHWFVLCQTEGREYEPVQLPEWVEAWALATLGIDRIAFQHVDGNAQGYAVEHKVAVSPVAFAPHRTLFHEIAHVVLGHTEELRRLDDGEERAPRNIREVEAESVALICCESLDLPGSEFSRGYIQHWLRDQTIPERSCQRIFKAADEILKAGQHTPSEEDSNRSEESNPFPNYLFE